MTINGIPFRLRECSFQSINHETTDRIICSICGRRGDFFFFDSSLAAVCYTVKMRKSLTCPCFSSQSLFSFSIGYSEVLSGAGRPVGGAGPEGDPVLCCLQLLGHCSVDQRWPGSGHWRGPAGWDIIQPPRASFSLFSVWLRQGFRADSDTLWLEPLTGKNVILHV